MEPYEGRSAESQLEFDDPERRGYEPAKSGTAKLLTIFFGVAVVCAIFFGLGYKLGKGAAPDTASVVQEPAPVAASGPKPSAVSDSAPHVRQASATTDRSAESPGPIVTNAQKEKPGTAGLNPVAASVNSAARGRGSFAVQVAAVTKEEDAEALVSALRKKDYPVFVVGNQAGDKFFHVQVGPFSSQAEAEVMRARLAADGYNPIVKK